MMKFSSASFIFRFIVLHVLTLSSAIVNAQQASDSCSVKLSLNDLSFDLSQLQCAEVWGRQNYILRYARTDANTWSFVLSAPDLNSYIAIGFSTNGQMVGSSAVVGWLPSGGGGGGEVKQYFLGGKTPTQVVAEQGDLRMVNGSMKIATVSSRLYLSFQLTMATAEQPRTRLLYALGRAGAFPSSPAYTLTEHRTMVSTSLNYITGVQRAVKTPYTRLRKTHGLMNMLGWGVVIIIGALVARHLKKWEPMWFYAHTALQTTGFLLGLTGVICGLVLENRTGASVSTHKGLGITIFVLGCLQVMALLARPDKQSKYRRYWNWYHHNVGRVVMILAIANVFYGIHLADAGTAWNAGYGFAVAVLSLVAIALEVKKFMDK